MKMGVDIGVDVDEYNVDVIEKLTVKVASECVLACPDQVILRVYL